MVIGYGLRECAKRDALPSIGTLVYALRHAPNFEPIVLACILINLYDAAVQFVLSILLGPRNPLSLSSLSIFTVVLVSGDFMQQSPTIMVSTARTG
jgi:hypothetical protein